jgi:hypothetical protein
MFWFFLALPLFPRKKALKKKVKTKSREKNDNFLLINGNAETNTPLQRYHFRLGQSERIVILKTENMSNKTHYMEACMTKGTSMASQFLTVPPGITNAGT